MSSDASKSNTTPLLTWQWLGSGRAYERVRRSLIFFFAGNGRGFNAEELADEVFSIVDKKLTQPKFISTYQGEKAKYFLGVAKNVLKKLRRQPEVVDSEAHPELRFQESDEAKEWRSQCLDDCIRYIPSKWRSLTLRYYESEGAEKKRIRQNIARELGIGISALRVRMFRIRSSLRQCISTCIEKKDRLEFTTGGRGLT